VGKNAVAACSKTGKKLNDDTCAESAIDSQIQATNAPLGIHQEFWAEDCGGFTCMFRSGIFIFSLVLLFVHSHVVLE